MSREAFEAVQDHSKADHYGRNVLYAIARFTPATGGEVWVTLRTLADLSGCDKDTVSSRVVWLEQNGELRTRKEGAGRGTKIYYTILLPFGCSRFSSLLSDENEETTDPRPDNKTTDETKLLSDQIKLLSDQIALLSDQIRLLSDGTTDIVRPTSNTNTLNTDLKHQEHLEEPPYPPSPPNPFPFRPAGANPELTPADERVLAIAEVCGLDLTIPVHRRECEHAAAQLAKYSAAAIRARYTNAGKGVGWNWYWDDFRGKRGDMPTTVWLVKTIGQIRQAAKVTNGTGRKLSNAEIVAAALADVET